jgi:outer membrane immunogenic protein
MKRIFALTVLFTVIGVAFSFAGPMRMESKELTQQAPPPCDWTGFYVGVNAGVTEFQSRFTNQNNWAPDGEDESGHWGTTSTYDNTAFIGGGQAGYNYQWQDLVLGVEADFSGLGNANNNHFLASGDRSSDDRGWDLKGQVDFMATLRGRLGISFNNNRAMIYGTAGGAYAHGDWHANSFDKSTPSEGLEWTGDDGRWGWTGGFGFEYAFNCHWSLRAEALYTWLNSDTQDPSGPSDSSNVDLPFRYRFEDNLWSYRIGLNYKFGGGR